MIKRFALATCLLYLLVNCTAQRPINKTNNPVAATNNSVMITPGAEQMDKYLPLLKGKNVALLVNQTSVVGKSHLVDALLKAGVTIKVIFGPEHGFRGDAPDGAKIETTTDPKTGIPLVSLYGKKNKPAPEDLKDIDIMVYDIQDVGTRFYTFISSMQYFMEAALENNIPLLILDRPNPNGFYVDGPVLDVKFKSFVGMQPVPVVYGMTIAEYAQMLLQEGWLSKEANDAFNVLKTVRYKAGSKYFQLQVIPVLNYTHNSRYVLPVSPSPNLPQIQSVYWYASTCFFEGTTFSEGRGTAKPFQYIGHPAMPHNLFSFTPVATAAAPSPKHKGVVCYGYDLSGTPAQVLQKTGNKIQLHLLLDAYKLFPDKDAFFTKNNGLNRLAGTDELMQQIKDGKSEAEIRKSWEPKLIAFKAIREKYLLYPDFTKP